MYNVQQKASLGSTWFNYRSKGCQKSHVSHLAFENQQLDCTAPLHVKNTELSLKLYKTSQDSNTSCTMKIVGEC